MKTVKKTSIFPASKKKVFDKLLKLRTLQYIASFRCQDGIHIGICNKEELTRNHISPIIQTDIRSV